MRDGDQGSLKPGARGKDGVVMADGVGGDATMNGAHISKSDAGAEEEGKQDGGAGKQAVVGDGNQKDDGDILIEEKDEDVL